MTVEKDSNLKSASAELKAKRDLFLLRIKSAECPWDTINSSVSDYESTFIAVLEEKKISEMLNKHSNPIVIDLMAAPGTVDELINEQLQKGRGLAVGLNDHNYEEKYKGEQDKLKAYNAPDIGWLQRDITLSETWKDIDKWLKGEKAHLIMERAVAGLGWLPINGRLYSILLDNAWKRLDPNGGILLFQAPLSSLLERNGIYPDKWIELLQKNEIEARYSPTTAIGTSSQFMITKRPDSPQVLPFHE